jgi:hypothetical protein
MLLEILPYGLMLFAFAGFWLANYAADRPRR